MLNRNIGGIAQARQALCAAARRASRVARRAKGRRFAFYFRADGGRVALATRHEGSADATPVGHAARAAGARRPARRGSAARRRRPHRGRCRGRAAVSRPAAQARPDFEEELSRVIGDVAAHQVANVARGFLDWGRKAGGSFATNVAEYLQEEGRDLPRASSRGVPRRRRPAARSRRPARGAARAARIARQADGATRIRAKQ